MAFYVLKPSRIDTWDELAGFNAALQWRPWTNSSICPVTWQLVFPVLLENPDLAAIPIKDYDDYEQGPWYSIYLLSNSSHAYGIYLNMGGDHAN